jgi:hypothetical protein
MQEKAEKLCKEVAVSALLRKQVHHFRALLASATEHVEQLHTISTAPSTYSS